MFLITAFQGHVMVELATDAVLQNLYIKLSNFAKSGQTIELPATATIPGYVMCAAFIRKGIPLFDV